MCGLAGLTSPSVVDGCDLSGDVLGKSTSVRDCVFTANYTSHWDYFQTGTYWPEWRGVQTHQYTYAKWLSGEEMLFDNVADPYQMHNLAGDASARATLQELHQKLKELMISAHDDFLNGRQYAAWYDKDRNLTQTALGRVPCAV